MLSLAVCAKMNLLLFEYKESDMIFKTYKPGESPSVACAALEEMMREVDVGVSYADTIRLRLSGALADQCNDTYYVALDGDRALARHWNGWGKHPDAIGNWGNFYTDAACRGQGIGGALLRFWEEDFNAREDLPLCFLCSAATRELVAWYSKFGFRVAIEGTEFGALYMPIGNSPSSFREFYTGYYKPSAVLYHKRATFEHRHEIDCLLRFALRDLGASFGIGECTSLESALLYYPERAGLLFSLDGHCVGWSIDGEIQTYPLYEHSEIVMA